MSSDLIARIWVLDLRQQSFLELGGTACPTDIWQCVRRHIDTGEITNRGVLVALSAKQEKRVRDKARRIAEHALTVDAYAVI